MRRHGDRFGAAAADDVEGDWPPDWPVGAAAAVEGVAMGDVAAEDGPAVGDTTADGAAMDVLAEDEDSALAEEGKKKIAAGAAATMT